MVVVSAFSTLRAEERPPAPDQPREVERKSDERRPGARRTAGSRMPPAESPLTESEPAAAETPPPPSAPEETVPPRASRSNMPPAPAPRGDEEDSTEELLRLRKENEELRDQVALLKKVQSSTRAEAQAERETMKLAVEKAQKQAALEVQKAERVAEQSRAAEKAALNARDRAEASERLARERAESSSRAEAVKTPMDPIAPEKSARAHETEVATEVVTKVNIEVNRLNAGLFNWFNTGPRSVTTATHPKSTPSQATAARKAAESTPGSPKETPRKKGPRGKGKAKKGGKAKAVSVEVEASDRVSDELTKRLERLEGQLRELQDALAEQRNVSQEQRKRRTPRDRD